jgi:hypothetical protein
MRTVRNGIVLVCGRRYAVDQRQKKYDGRLDGMRFAFYTYFAGGAPEPYVALIDTEARYKLRDQGSKLPQPHIMEGGALPWNWWNLVEV